MMDVNRIGAGLAAVNTVVRGAEIGDWVPANLRAAVSEHVETLKPIKFESLALSPRLKSCMMYAGHLCLGDVLGISKRDLLKIREFGLHSLNALKVLLQDVVSNIGDYQNGSALTSTKPTLPDPIISPYRSSPGPKPREYFPGDWVPDSIKTAVEAHRDLLIQIPFEHLGPRKSNFLGITLPARAGIWAFDAQIGTLGEVLARTTQDYLRAPNFGRKTLNQLGTALEQIVAKLNSMDWVYPAAVEVPSPVAPVRKNQDSPGNWVPADLKEAVLRHSDAIRNISRTYCSKGVTRFDGIRLTSRTGDLLFSKRWGLWQVLRRSRRDLYQTGFRKENIDELVAVLGAVIEKVQTEPA